MIPASDIDRLLLSSCDARWRKVARIIGQAYENPESRGIAISRGIAKLMDARLAVMVRSGKLEAKGNVERWGLQRGAAGGARSKQTVLEAGAGEAEAPSCGDEASVARMSEATSRVNPRRRSRISLRSCGLHLIQSDYEY